MSKSNRLAGLVLLTVAMGTLPLLGAQGQESPAESEDKVVFSVGDDNKPDSLNPFVGIEAPSYYIWAFSYDLLVDFSQEDLGPAPGLAESWEVSDDGLTWTYQLREGMKWSDGEPITANDVVYTYNRVIDDNIGMLKGYLTLVDEITVVDDLTLEIKTTKPTPLMTSVFIYIMPEHIWSDISDEEAKTFENVPAVGSGPYTIEESVEGQFVRLEANENHWGGRPEVDEIIYRIFNNADAAFQALKSGEIDYTYELPANLYK